MKNLLQPYVHTYELFKAAGMKVARHKNTSQEDLSDEEKRSLNLLGIASKGLMHCKTRYFRWPAAKSYEPPEELVVSGSLNPETTASTNDDTLIVVREQDTVARYLHIYDTILNVTATPARYATPIDTALAVPRAGRHDSN